ncbi:MAG: PRC-barrel domain containing protein [Bacteroidia bacterium]|nr:PRC-barrel domain containing protein [Bacteroidia bacterium]
MAEIQSNLLISTSAMHGMTVRNRVDDKLGRIEDVVLDTNYGAIVYVVMSVSEGFLGLKNKYFAIPWDAFSFEQATDHVLILNVEKDKLEHSPGFDKDNWPKTPQSEFVSDLYNHYEYRPYYDRNR